MIYRLRLLCLAAAMASALAIPSTLYGQIFNGQQQEVLFPILQKQLRQWEVYRIDAAGLYDFVKTNPSVAPTQLHLGAHHWQLALTPSPILGPNYTLQVLTSRGRETIIPTAPKAFRGHDLAGGGLARLTLDHDFVYGFVEEGGERYYIEPLWYYVPAADRNLFVLYAAKDVNRDIDATCAVLESAEKLQHLQNSEPPRGNEDAEFMACYQVELAIASDRSMFLKYGSAGGVENHNLGVINNTEADYTSGAFNHDLTFVIVTQFVSAGVDPWTTSTDAENLLDSFVAWGNSGNFGESFDLGELWTDRNFDGGTVGIAYLDAVCTSVKYHCLQDFTGNAELLRCMTSHEIGHNFSCDHDGGGCPPNYIMCPFVSNSSQWSTGSINSVNNFVTFLIASGCLSSCGGSSVPLSADFDWSPGTACTGEPVQFDNFSSGNITGYTWSFPAGSPPFSNQINPTVTWNVPGTYQVTLSLSGIGGPVSISKAITVVPLPEADFSYTASGTTLFFNNNSNHSTRYDWNFGDGNSSTDANPEHTFSVAGLYTVQLTASNDCGSATQTITINTEPTADFTSTQPSGCTPLYVQFTNLSSANAETYFWEFPGGIPSNSTAYDPYVTYLTPGTYPVTLTATNATGSNAITQNTYVTVYSQPTAAFSSTVTGATASFTNTSTNSTSYAWNFGDNTTANTAAPSHTYTADGTYTVTLTATNNCGTSTATQSVVIATQPTASFSATNTSGCGPLTVQFNGASSLNAQTFQWQFPGGTPASATGQNPSVVYHTPGTYSVTLTVGNATGSNTAAQTDLVVVHPGPTAAFGGTILGTTASFTNTSTNATTYAWDFGDNTTANVAAPSHTYAADGAYTVTLTATNTCGSSTATQTVVVATTPTAGFTATNTSGCGPLSVQFTSTSSLNAQTFQWQFPGGTPGSSTAQNPTVVYNTAGTYSVTLTVSNVAGANTATQTNLVVVNPLPTAAFGSTVSGTTASFTNTSSHASTYAWNFGDNTTANTATPSHTYAANGTYTVTLTATNGCGSNTITQPVTIAIQPTAGFTATNTSGCGPLTVQFTNTSSANAQTFQWQFPGGNPGSSTAQNPTVVYNTAGSYSVTLTVGNAAGTNTSTQTSLVVVNPSPTAAFGSTVAGTTASFTNTSTNATTYAWNFGDNTTANTATPSHTYTADGTYTVTLTATNSCGTSTATHPVVIATPPTAGFTATNTSGCGPLSVQFTNASSANAQAFNWQFPGGSPSSSTAQNPTVIYNTAGTYPVTLTVSNAAGANTATQTNLVVVNPSPTAAFSSTVTGTTASFTNTSTNATSYAWSFGDNTTATSTAPSHIYITDGSYTVTLTATNSCGASTVTHTVVIATPPTASFTATNTAGCSPLSVQFNNTSSLNAQTFQWQFPGGTPGSSTAQNPTVVYHTAGTYPVTLTVGNTAGTNTATQNILVVVTPGPTAGFSSTVAGATASFTNTSTNATTYSWSFGDNTTANTATPSHTYTADGTYTVTLTATNSCGTNTFTQNVVIITAPNAGFTANTTTGCAALTVQFSDLSSSNTTAWNWTFPGGTPGSSTAQHPTVIYETPGTYDVLLVASTGAGNSTYTQNGFITILGPPTPAFTTTNNGATFSFANTSANAATYQWDFGDGSSSVESNPTHTYANNGLYQVTLLATNNCGLNTYTQEVSVSTAPTAAFSVSSTKGCAPLAVQFANQSSPNVASFAWTFAGGNPDTSSASSPVVTWNQPGTYEVLLLVSNGAGTDTASTTITVLALPTAAFTIQTTGLSVSFANTSANGTSYTWKFGDGASSTEPNPTHEYAAAGTYAVELTVANSCGAATLQQTFTVMTVGTTAPDWLSHFRVYPNPNPGRFTVEMHGTAQQEVEFALFNAMGQLVHRQIADFRTGDLNQLLDCTRLPAALYTLRISAGEQSTFVKIVVQQ